MAKDLRSFLELLEARHPEEIVRITKGPLRPAEGECAAILKHLQRMGKQPAAIFEHVATLGGDRWPGAVVYQSDGTWRKLAIALGLDSAPTALAVQLETMRRAANPILPVVIEPEDAPARKVVRSSEEVSFFDLPAYRSNEDDARPGWLTGIVVARDPDTGRYNCSWHRDLILSPDRAVCNAEPRHLMEIVSKYRERGEEWMPFAQVFGHHVLFRLAAAMRPGLEVDEYAFAGGILGEPLRLTPSATWGENLLIPADAEVVLEGYMATSERAATGPWADVLRYYAPSSNNPVIRLAAVNLRHNPIFEHTWVGQDVSEDIATGAFVQQMLASRFPGVRAVNYVLPGMMVVQFKPTRDGDVARVVGLAHSYGDLVKHVIVVDEDVDPFDLSQVLWSVATRTDAARQTYVVPVSTHRLDPAATLSEVSGARIPNAVGALVIDSCRPVGRAFDQVGQPAEQTLSRIRLEDYVPESTLDRLATAQTTRPWAAM